MNTNIDAIQQFITYFRDQTENISNINSSVFQKIIYVTALDTMARAAFGKEYKNRDRNIYLLEKLTNWKDRDRVSLPQLSLALEKKGLLIGPLYNYTKMKLDIWPRGQVLLLDNSPQLAELEIIAQAPERDILPSCRYAALFYTYRNNLIHEFREPGYGFEISTVKDQPYYLSMLNEPWQLVFPIGFFKWLYAETLVGLEKFLTDENINPYSQFEFGSQWHVK